MTTATEHRKLAAIMFTDMVGYSALSQRDDKLALELLEEHRQLLREIFPRFNGTEIKTIGDAFLVEFNSALEAAQCAIEIQRTLAKRNHDVVADRRIELKIGIHIGDVVHRGGDVYGDGVNIASRIEPLAGAGGICVSMDVERQIRNAVETRFEKLATTELKNISVPMELFRIVLPWERKSEVRGQKSEIRKEDLVPASRRFALIGGLVLLLIIGIGWWWTTLSRKSPPAPGQPVTRASDQPANIPDKSIAVLPFDNLSDDKSNAYFAEGIQDEILTRLSKIAALKVISRTSTQKYKSAPDNLREVGKQLGVANLLEGSVQKIANAVHVNVQLIRVATDEHLWAESYNRKLDDVFGVEGEVATAIADQLNARLSGAEQKAVTDKLTQNVAAYDAYLRGAATEHTQYSYDAYKEVARDYAEAVQQDPKFALAWARLAVIRSFLYFNAVDRNTNTPEAVKEAVDRARSLAPDAGESWIALGAYRYRILRDFEGSVAAYKEAQSRLPNNSYLQENLAFVLRRLGRWQEAEVNYKKALELDPRDVQLLNGMGNEFYNYLRRFDDAHAMLDRALKIGTDSETAHANKASVLQSEGRLAEAAQELAPIPPDATDDFVLSARVGQAIYERHFNTAIDVIERKVNAIQPGQPLDSITDLALVQLGFCQEWTGRYDDARRTFTRAVSAIKPTPDTVVAPEANGIPSTLALAYAGLGEKEKALEQAKQAVNDYATDAIAKPQAEITLAQIQARFGDHDAAIAALPRLLEVPAGLTIANLKLDPFWDPLRKDPRFQKLCQERPK
jgi:TolB-like protein/class 3 adenylate cyclase/Tfp pilus assembly protein PilF